MCRSYSEMHSPMRYEVTIAKISGLRRPGARPPGPPGSINCLTSHLKYLFDTLRMAGMESGDKESGQDSSAAATASSAKKKKKKKSKAY